MNQEVKDSVYDDEDILSPVTDALKDGDLGSLKVLIQDQHTSDIAELLNQCEKQDRVKIIAVLGDVDPDILPFLEQGAKEDVTSLIGAKNSAEAIGQLESDEAIQFVEDLSDKKIEGILEELEGEKKQELQAALNYPEDSAGRLANKQYVTTHKDSNVGNIIDMLREDDHLPEDFYTIFVVDEDERPLSYVPLSRIMRNKRAATVKDLKEDLIKIIPVDMDQEEVAVAFQKYGLISAPVVDERGSMIGVITVDDIANVIEEEIEEDIMNLAGVGSGEDVISGPYKKFKNRSPWLFVNMVTSVLASLVISMFEGEIQQLVALAVLMPIVASMSGNAGSQTLTVAVRAIATKELTFANFPKVLRREITTALINGCIFGVITSLAAFAIYSNLQLSIVMLVAVISTFLLAAISGSAIPLIMHRMNFDPAVSSSALVYAITDMSSFFLFLGIASLILL